MTFKKSLLLLGLTALLGCSSARPAHTSQASSEEQYHVTIDLTKVKEDKVQVTVLAPELKQEEIIYNMPKIVPGTYSISDFGKFVSEFSALDNKGRKLVVEKLDENRWRIKEADKLQKITYWVDDTFDAAKKTEAIFEPGGTNIEASKNFLLNTFGFVGYFDGLKQLPFRLTITKPQGFYGSTPLKATSSTATSDTYLLPDYVTLADSPLMYNAPDTTVLDLGETDVLVSVYSPSGKVKSKPIAANIKDILQAQRNYLGGKLPVDKYAFLIYVPEKVGKSGSFGALEHSNSSVYFLPEMPEEQFSSTMRDVAAHEFFHIVTPLTIHSEQIGNFDFINPDMSKHLWMYEGVTEYFASHVQVYEKLIDLDAYLNKIQEYIATSKAYYNDTLPFTEMSAKVLGPYEKEYGNVYQKGALIGLVLDVRLRELSQGKYGLRDLMQELGKTYGKNKSFKDEELFDKIAELTYPEIREFFTKYVEGSEPLPLEETFKKVGITYEPMSKQLVNSYGGFVPGYDNESGKIIVEATDDMDAFGKELGLKPGDRLLKWNGKEMSPSNVRQLIGEDLQKMKPGDDVTVTVGRLEKKKLNEVTLKAKVRQAERIVPHYLQPDPKATPQQLALRAAWLNINAQ
ncbi:PDZ domain-containing protein [Pontibacter sp. KCTC 32443]|uniref:M61 family metallopeptidase n=1 Tax=Pontibacter TaxID=323449 RepID=UPI00164DE817|nr:MULTISPECIES: PDZ domain-containing protein [Pontibacter]MBC5772484.1 PDZ domain-containing protein [Pontibacter sp. KCTC 32443]